MDVKKDKSMTELKLVIGNRQVQSRDAFPPETICKSVPACVHSDRGQNTWQTTYYKVMP